MRAGASVEGEGSRAVRSARRRGSPNPSTLGNSPQEADVGALVDGASGGIISNDAAVAYRDELEALRARLAVALAERDAARAEVERLKSAIGEAPARLARARTPELLPKPAWRSIPGGEPARVTFINDSERKLELVWLSYDGRERSAGTLIPGGRIRLRSRTGDCWRLVDAASGDILAHHHVTRADEAFVHRE